MVKNFGRAKLSDFFGDWVIYRNLEPLDKRLPWPKIRCLQNGIGG